MNKYLSKHASMRVAALCTSALLVSSGCQQGLFDNDDSQWRVPDEKLQEIERLDVDAALRAPRESLDDATKRAVDEVIPKVERTDEVLLSLSDVRSAVLANNLDLRTQLISPAIASAALAQEEAKFQSVFFANWDRNDGNLLSDLSGGDNIDQDAFNAGVNIPLATGGTVSFSAPFAQAASGFGAPDEDWQGGLSASMSQPLLRNAGVDVNTASIRVARWQGQIADARTKLEAVRILAASDRAYWNFYSAYRELDVRRKQYEVALEQLERAKRRVRGGDAAEIEVIRAESGVGGTLQSIIVADATLRIRQRELKRLMARDDLPVAGSTPMKPASEPNPVGLKLDAAVLAKKAIAGRMEMLELELQLAVDLTNIDLARNQELPLFMLDYGYTLQGQGSSFDDAYAQIGNADQFNVGLSAEISLGNDAAKAAVSQAILTRVQRLATKDARRQGIEQEIYDAVDTMEQSWQAILAARLASVLAARTMQAEQRQFDVGLRTSTDVLDAVAKLADAQSGEVRALAAHEIALVDAAFATGTVLGSAKIRWEAFSESELDALERLPDATSKVPTERSGFTQIPVPAPVIAPAPPVEPTPSVEPAPPVEPAPSVEPARQ